MTPALKPVPAVKNPGTVAAMIAVASSQVGFREGGNNDNAFGRWYGMNNAAWCAMFVSWAASVSGNSKAIPKHAYTPTGASWFKARGQWFTKPKVGDIVYYYNASLGRIAHVGLVTAVHSDGSWTACEGNTSNTGSRTGNGVYLLKRTTTRGGGFGRPKYATAPKPPVPPVVVPPVVKVPPNPNPVFVPLEVDYATTLAAARETGLYGGPVAAALILLGFTPDVPGYAALQKALGWTDAVDLDGRWGPTSAAWLAARFGFAVKGL